MSLSVPVASCSFKVSPPVSSTVESKVTRASTWSPTLYVPAVVTNATRLTFETGVFCCPEGDQGLEPSPRAVTCTRYVVSGTRPSSVASVSVASNRLDIVHFVSSAGSAVPAKWRMM